VLQRLSLRARLVLGVLVLAAAGLLVADVATYKELSSFLIDRTDRSLDGQHRVVETAIQHGGQVTPTDLAALRAQGPGLYIQLRSQ